VQYAQAVPLKYVIDPGISTWPRNADLKSLPHQRHSVRRSRKRTDLKVGAVVWPRGRTFDPAVYGLPQFQCPNIVTTLEFGASSPPRPLWQPSVALDVRNREKSPGWCIGSGTASSADLLFRSLLHLCH
jgi:hypothetical protein